MNSKSEKENLMKRRDFLKAMGLGTAYVVLPSCDNTLKKPSSKKVKDEILGQVDTRIEKYRKGDVVLKLTHRDKKPLKLGLNVNIEQTNHKFLFGANIFKLYDCGSSKANTAYEKHFAELLNYATLPFYWARYEPQPAEPRYVRTEEILRWCRAHNVTPKGHPLVWNLSDPKWIPKDPEEAMQVQFKRVRRCVQKFRGAIDIWDVVNEATHYDRPHFLERAPILTEGITKIGVGSYVRHAFESAREINPNATLIINDYRTDEAFEQKVLSELVDEDGWPLYDVIGIQSHMHTGYWGVEKTWDVCERFTKFGKPLHFTEATILSGKLKEDDDWFSRRQGWLTTDEGEKRQAKQATEFYRLLFSHPAVEAITWWDFTDYKAWQEAPAGFIRTDMTPKPAYEKLKQLIKNKWWTQTKTKSAANGETPFRGFYGQYKVTARSAGRELKGTFAFDKTTKKPINVQLS